MAFKTWKESLRAKLLYAVIYMTYGSVINTLKNLEYSTFKISHIVKDLRGIWECCTLLEDLMIFFIFRKNSIHPVLDKKG